MKVKGITVGRKSESAINVVGRRNYLSAVGGFELSEPNAFLAPDSIRINHVLAVGRNNDVNNLSVSREFLGAERRG